MNTFEVAFTTTEGEGMPAMGLAICAAVPDGRSWMGTWGGATPATPPGGTGKVTDTGASVYVGIPFTCFPVGISCLRMEPDVKKAVFCEALGLTG